MTFDSAIELAMSPLWLALCAVALCLLTGAGVLPGLVLAARRAARVTRRSAYERCAVQMTFLALCFGLVLCAAGGGLAFLWQQGMLVASEASPFSRLAPFFSLAPWLAGLMAASGLLSMALRLVNVRSATAICLAFGTMVGVWTLIAAGGSVFLTLLMSGPESATMVVEQNIPYALLPALFHVPLLQPPAACGLLLGLFACGLSSAGGLALIVQMLRRSMDDYGRDYYMLAARWCAGKAMWGGIVQAFAMAVLGWMLQAGGGDLWLRTLIGAGVALISTLAWLAVARSENPLRWKVLMCVGALGIFFFAATAVNLAAAWTATAP